MSRLTRDFFLRDVLEVAPDLLNCSIVLPYNNQQASYIITEVEAYKGEEDLACHASKGRTRRTEIMYGKGGHLYIYLIYGMYYMLNIVTGEADNPQAVLIRGIQGYNGPGKLTRHLKIDKSYYGLDICNSDKLWIENKKRILPYHTSPRIGIEYAGEKWAGKPWRFYINTF